MWTRLGRTGRTRVCLSTWALLCLYSQQSKSEWQSLPDDGTFYNGAYLHDNDVYALSETGPPVNRFHSFTLNLFNHNLILNVIPPTPTDASPFTSKAHVVRSIGSVHSRRWASQTTSIPTNAILTGKNTTTEPLSRKLTRPAASNANALLPICSRVFKRHVHRLHDRNKDTSVYLLTTREHVVHSSTAPKESKTRAKGRAATRKNYASDSWILAEDHLARTTPNVCWTWAFDCGLTTVFFLLNVHVHLGRYTRH